ncbi:hypothetical protein OJJOAM_001177 [Cupriavidus sp. H18C1]
MDDHAALHYALKHARQVWCAFVFDREILDPLLARSLARGLTNDRRVAFILASLAPLDKALREAGGGLIVLHAAARTAIPELARELDVQAVFANHDYEPAAIERDRAVADALAADARLYFSFKDQVVFERDEILNGQGKPFSVFTPYKNAWLKALQPFDLRPYPVAPYLPALAPLPPGHDRPLPTLEALGFAPAEPGAVPLAPGSPGAHALFDAFLDRLGDYARRRDFPRGARAQLSVGASALRHHLDPYAGARRACGDAAGRGGRQRRGDVAVGTDLARFLFHGAAPSPGPGRWPLVPRGL